MKTNEKSPLLGSGSETTGSKEKSDCILKYTPNENFNTSREPKRIGEVMDGMDIFKKLADRRKEATT